jgi:ABC-type branched-subunit amino acid transport system permease subunit
MEKTNRVTVSLALTLLVCFFLPWVQVSCGAEKDTASGLDLARDGETGLWLVPLLTIVVVVCGLRLLRIDQRIFALITLLCGLVVLYLMNHQRARFEETTGIIQARLTFGFWLGLIAAIGTAISGGLALLKRPRAP